MQSKLKQVTIQGDSRMENVKDVDENIETTKKKKKASNKPWWSNIAENFSNTL